jgi:hypothetical protein
MAKLTEKFSVSVPVEIVESGGELARQVDVDGAVLGDATTSFSTALPIMPVDSTGANEDSSLIFSTWRKMTLGSEGVPIVRVTAAGLASSTSLTNPYANYALALDFDDQQYWSGGTQAASLSALSGYTFTRSGTQGAIDSDNSIDSFAANVPAINGNGYHAYGALTNLLLRSQEFDNASWGNYASASVTANTSTAPDGATTADTITFDADPTSEVFQIVDAASATYAVSVWAKVASGTRAFRIKVYDGVGNNYSSDFTATTSWQRFTYIHTGAVNNVSIANAAAGGTGSIFAWQAQMLPGNFPDGGPIIVTAGSTAAIGASALDVDSPNLPAGDFLIWASGELNGASVEGDSLLFLDDGTANNGIHFYVGGTSYISASTWAAGSVTYQVLFNGATNSGKVAVALRRSSGILKFFAYRNGAFESGGSPWDGANTGAVPTINRAWVGYQPTVENPWRGPISGAFITSGTFSDAEVQAILEAA